MSQGGIGNERCNLMVLYSYRYGFRRVFVFLIAVDDFVVEPITAHWFFR